MNAALPAVALRPDPAADAIGGLLAPHALLRGSTGEALARFHSASLTSQFQRIVSADHALVLGAEAYVRVASGAGPGLSPWQLSASGGHGAEVVALDRLCRALHVANFGAGFLRGERLFLNVHPELPEVVKSDFGLSFRRIVSLLGQAPEHTVLELRFDTSAPPGLVRDVIRGWRARGLGVALDLGIGPTRATPAALATRGVQPDYLKFTPCQELDFISDALEAWRQRGAGPRVRQFAHASG